MTDAGVLEEPTLPHHENAATRSAALAAERVTHFYRAPEQGEQDICVLRELDVQVEAGEFLAIVGTSGCGKTTLLNMFAGLISPTYGVVRRSGEIVRGPDRSVGYMVARSGLLPWRKARANIELGLELRRVPKHRRRELADQLLRTVGLEGFGGAYPAQLSQGMRQRVALARTLAVEPAFLLMDEPFGALDAQTKLIMQAEFMRLWEESRATVVFVTHDLSEAVAVADRVIVMSARPGRIKADIAVDLPRPRALGELRFSPRYQELSEQVWRALRDELIHGDGQVHDDIGL